MDFISLTPCERALLCGRARKFYTLRFPETSNGYTGVGLPRPADAPETFRNWATAKFNINSKTLYRYRSLYGDLGERLLIKLLDTDCNDLASLQALRKLASRDRDRYVERNAKPLENPRPHAARLADMIGVPL